MTSQAADKSVDLQELIQTAQLPALPQSAIKLLQLSKDPDIGPEDFAIPIEADPGLASQVLKFVNSSYFGFSGEIATVKMAITLVGVRTIKNFALWSAVFSLMPNPKCGPLDLKKLWQDSLRRAVFARLFSKELGLRDAEEPFAAALLQDMAIPLLAKELTGDYEMLLQERSDMQCQLSDLEQQRFGWSHVDAGKQLCANWNLPDEFGVLIGRHNEAANLIAEGVKDPGQIAVSLSALLPATIDGAWPERAAFEEAYEKVGGRRARPIVELLEDVDAGFEEFAPVLEVSAPPKSLMELYREDRGEVEESVPRRRLRSK